MSAGGFKYALGEQVSHALAPWNQLFRCMVVVGLRLEVTEGGAESRTVCVRLANGGTVWFGETELGPPWADPQADAPRFDS